MKITICGHCEIEFASRGDCQRHQREVHHGGGKKKLAFEEFVNDRPRKKILIEERGHRCESCGLGEWQQKPIPLQLDHIDGNSDNHDRSNLRLMCPNCHALTPTFCGRNIGKGTSKRNRRRNKFYRD